MNTMNKKNRWSIIIFIAIFALKFNLQLHAQPWPHSDPGNADRWVLNTHISDEFERPLDESKWLIQGRNGEYQSNWIGRAPSQFSPNNVRVENGMLKIQTRWEPSFPFSTTPQKDGTVYENITTAAVIAKTKFLYGYMEICCKCADASVTSAFWGTGDGMELDVFEHLGKPSAPNKGHLETELWSSIHDWHLAGGPTIWTDRLQLPFRVAGGFHTYGLEWDENYLKFWADGVLVRTVTKDDVERGQKFLSKGGEDWKINEPMHVWVDSETFPWHGLPVEADLPVDYEIKYIRVWQKDFKTGPISVSKIEISNPTLYMSRGQRGNLNAKVYPWNADNNSYTWSSNNNSVARVTSNGTVIAQGNGTCRITATTADGNKTASTVVTVANMPSNNLVLNGDFETGDLSYWDMSNGSVKAASRQVYEGNYTGNVYGAGSIKQKVAVRPNTVYTVTGWGKVASNGQSIVLGLTKAQKNGSIKFLGTNYEKKSFNITTGPEDNFVEVYLWHGRSNFSGYVDKISITGGPETVPATGVNISSTSEEVLVGERINLSASVIPANAENKRVTWSTSNSEIATVNASGVVTTRKSGNVEIVATSVQGRHKATCNVKVKHPVVSYEAENASRIKFGNVKSIHQGFSGTGYVTPNRRVGSFIEWNNVNNGGGESVIGFTYANRNNPLPCDVYVNGVKAGSLPFNVTGNWTTYVNAELSVTLNSGNNTIKVITTSNAGGPNIDKLDVQNNRRASTRNTRLRKRLKSAENLSQSVNNDVKLYPNPYRGTSNLNIELESPESIYVVVNDMHGKVVYAKDFGQNSTFTLKHSFAPGVYLVNIVRNDKMTVKKLIVK